VCPANKLQNSISTAAVHSSLSYPRYLRSGTLGIVAELNAVQEGCYDRSYIRDLLTVWTQGVPTGVLDQAREGSFIKTSPAK
jgi:hypothetical protein